MLSTGTSMVWLEGDVLRSGLNVDLGFSRRDRTENIRRTAEVAKLLNAAGALVVCSLISPLAEQRALAQAVVGEGAFYEVYVKASVAICEARDPHGLYQRARSGDVAEFTGVDATYEPPIEPHLTLDTEIHSIEECLQKLLAFLKGRSL